jgi:hypothetical protein
MTDQTDDQPKQAVAAQDSEAVPVLITFALLFLLSAAVWFLLDRIRADEMQTELTRTAAHGPAASGSRVANKVAAAK